MQNVIAEIEVLQNTLTAEKTLRDATTIEFNNGNETGPMRAAHDQSILNVLSAARNLINKAAQ